MHPDTIEIDLMSIFSQIGSVKNTRIIRTHENTCRGYAFVVFDSYESVKKAIDTLQGFVLHNKPMILRNSLINHVLFLVGIKRSWSREHIEKLIKVLFSGVSKVYLIVFTGLYSGRPKQYKTQQRFLLCQVQYTFVGSTGTE